MLKIDKVIGLFRGRMRKLSLMFCFVVLILLGLGCTGPTWQGWSGFTSYEGDIYFGTMDGRVLAINMSARSQGLPFPSEGEWLLPVKRPAPAGGMCGPMGCVPTAQPATIYGTPAISDNIVYVATYAGDSGKIMAINRLAPGYDKDGVPAWNEGEWFYPRSENKYIGSVVGGPIVVEDTLYVGSSDGKLYALDENGGEKWAPFDTGSKIWTSPAVGDGAVYVSNYGGKLFAVSSRDGSLIWEIELPSSIASSPAISGGSIYFGTFDRNLYAVAVADGSEKWKFEGGNWFWATPVVKDGVIYAGCFDHLVYALNAITGEKLWQFIADAPIVAPPAFSGDFLVVTSESGEMYVLEPDTGNLVRSVSIGYQVMAPLYAEENMVYVHARNRCIYAIDVQSGNNVWEFCYSDTE